MKEYLFEVRLRAVVRVRASSKEEGSKVVGSVLGAPSNLEIGLVNENNAALGRAAAVTAVDFRYTGEPSLITDKKPAGVETRRPQSNFPLQ
jgi:hypothetical protein